MEAVESAAPTREVEARGAIGEARGAPTRAVGSADSRWQTLRRMFLSEERRSLRRERACALEWWPLTWRLRQAQKWGTLVTGAMGEPSEGAVAGATRVHFLVYFRGRVQVLCWLRPTTRTAPSEQSTLHLCPQHASSRLLSRSSP